MNIKNRIKPAEIRKCLACLEYKPLSCFYKNSRTVDGYLYTCSDCTRSKRPKVEKYCPGCNTIKPLSEFFKQYNSTDGHQYYCKQCKKGVNKNWTNRNRERINANVKRWQSKNKEKVKASDHKSYWKRRDKKIASHKEWVKRNREYCRQVDYLRYWVNPKSIVAKNSRYLDRLRKAEGSFTPKEWQDKCNEYDNCCAYCGERKPLTRQHLIPLSKGGTNYILNIVPACRSCNSKCGVKIIYPPAPPITIFQHQNI